MNTYLQVPNLDVVSHKLCEPLLDVAGTLKTLRTKICVEEIVYE